MRQTLLTAAAALALALAPDPSRADTIVQTVQDGGLTPPDQVTPATETIAFTPFDTSLGTLQSADLLVTFGGEAAVGMQNLSQNTIPVTLAFQAVSTITYADQTPVTSVTVQAPTISGTLQPYTSGNPFSDASSLIQIEAGLTATQDTLLTAASDLAYFTDPNNAFFNISVMDTTAFGGDPSQIMEVSNDLLSNTIQITYTYAGADNTLATTTTTDVPEPAAWLLLGTSCAGLMIVRLMMARRRVVISL